MVGALMVDGLGDGLMVECATEDTDYLRTTSFGLLQVGRLVVRNSPWPALPWPAGEFMLGSPPALSHDPTTHLPPYTLHAARRAAACATPRPSTCLALPAAAPSSTCRCVGGG